MEFCVIAGGASGLGFELAKGLVEDGKNIVVVARNADKLREATEKLGSYDKGFVVGICADLAEDAGAEKVYEFFWENKYDCKLLINCAGASARGDIMKLDKAFFIKALEDNCISTALLTGKMLWIMREGAIVNIMSSASLRGNSNEGAYCMAKWGVRGYTEALRASLKDSRIKVLAVYPSGMKTPFWKNDADCKENFMQANEVAKIILDNIPDCTKTACLSELIIEKIN